MSSSIKRIYEPPHSGTLRQCELISKLTQALIVPGSLGSSQGAVIEIEQHPYAVVLSQDCDLELDFKSRSTGKIDDKLLPSVLFCQAIETEVLISRNRMDSRIHERFIINKDERYHFLERIPAVEDDLGQGIPELGIDFKRYFSLATADVYEQLQSGEAKRRCVMLSPYLEHLSSRFSYYQCRVALPEDPESDSKPWKPAKVTEIPTPPKPLET